MCIPPKLYNTTTYLLIDSCGTYLPLLLVTENQPVCQAERISAQSLRMITRVKVEKTRFSNNNGYFQIHDKDGIREQERNMSIRYFFRYVMGVGVITLSFAEI